MTMTNLSPLRVPNTSLSIELSVTMTTARKIASSISSAANTRLLQRAAIGQVRQRITSLLRQKKNHPTEARVSYRLTESLDRMELAGSLSEITLTVHDAALLKVLKNRLSLDHANLKDTSPTHPIN